MMGKEYGDNTEPKRRSAMITRIGDFTIAWLGGLNARLGDYQPGNGTRYRAIAVPWHGGVDCGSLGHVDEGWLVISCITRKAYLFQKEGLLVDQFIKDKLGGTDGDYPYFGDLVRVLINRQHPRKEKQNEGRDTGKEGRSSSETQEVNPET